MRHSRLTAVLLTTAALLATPTVAQAATPVRRGPCTISLLGPLTPRAAVTCAAAAQVSVDTEYDAYTETTQPHVVHEQEAATDAVPAGGYWENDVAVPTRLYPYRGCATFAVNGTDTARSCFDRPKLASDGQPPLIEAITLTPMPAGWQISCAEPGGRMTMFGTYTYRSPDGRTRLKPFVRVKAMPAGQKGGWIDSVPVPEGATVISSVLTGVGVATDGTVTNLGTTTYHRLDR